MPQKYWMYDMINIYKLNFPSDTRVYIGKTYKPIHKRLAEHIEKLNNKTHNRKLLSAYPECGIPNIELLETCDNSISHNREIYWIEHFDSFKNGFNGNNGGWGGTSMPGSSNPSALYTEEDYECALVCLARTNWTIKEIADELNIGYSTVLGISSKSICNYLSKVLPEEWSMLDTKHRQKTSHYLSYYPNIKGPDGTVYVLTSISDFAKAQGISRSKINEVINGKREQVSGYRVC